MTESYFYSKKTLKAIKGLGNIVWYSLSPISLSPNPSFLYTISVCVSFSLTTVIHISQPLSSLSLLGATWCLLRHTCR